MVQVGGLSSSQIIRAAGPSGVYTFLKFLITGSIYRPHDMNSVGCSQRQSGWYQLMFLGFGCYGIEGCPHQCRLSVVTPLVLYIGRHQNGISLRNGVTLAAADQGSGPFQDEDYVLPLVGVSPGVGVADRSGLHGV